MFDTHHVQLVRIGRFLGEDEETAEELVMERFATPFRRWAAIRELRGPSLREIVRAQRRRRFRKQNRAAFRRH